jgi:nitrogen-specific signal transduction histidine kinase
MFETYKPVQFNPLDRKTPAEVKRQAEMFTQNKFHISLIESLSQMLVVLNKERQIIYANKLYYDFCGIPVSKSIIGKRPGEAINCIHAFLTSGGCGASSFCKTCGAANAIFESHKGIQSTKECRILTHTLESKNILVTSAPYEYMGEYFTIFSLTDISNKKKTETLERLFFHDLLNSASGISGLSLMLKELNDPKEITEIANIINRAADNLVEEIQAQRQLSDAERGELYPDFKEVNSVSVLNDLKDLFSLQASEASKSILIDLNSDKLTIITDPVLLRRILGNMVKNAIEVYSPKATITLSCRYKNESARFSVHNPAVIDENVQLQLFKRSFTTKGIGRGLGTYSMKLLGEKYLKGKVGFESTEQNGTTFFIDI